MRAGRVIVGVFALGLAATACGGSGGATGGASGGGAPESKIIAAGLLRAADLDGYRKGPVGSDTSGQTLKLAKRVRECRHFTTVAREGTHHRKSNSFGQDGVSVSDSVDVYPTAAVTRAQATLGMDRGTPGCMEGVLRLALAKGLTSVAATLDTVQVTALDPPSLGDGSFAWRVSVTITQRGRQLELVADQVNVAVGRFSLSLNTGINTPQALTPESRDLLLGRMLHLEQDLAPKLVDRMRAAGA